MPGSLSPRDLRQHLEIETPEQVHLDYEIAGLGSRTLAAAADVAILFAVLLIGTLVWALLPGAVARWGTLAVILTSSLAVLAYFALFEGLRQGQTPGKRWLGIRVIRDTGHGVNLAGSILRALLLPADLFVGIGAFLILLHPRGKRLADLVAGTVVVRDHPVEAEIRPPALASRIDAGALPRLTDQEFFALEQFVERASALPDEARQRVAGQLAIRLLDDPAAEEPTAALQILYLEEEGRRRGGRQAFSTSAATRLAARQTDRWEEFDQLARRVTRGGLDQLSAQELPAFAAQYREVAADLARARTYGGHPALIRRLERLVSAGHSALYRDEQRGWTRALRFLSQDIPIAVVEARREVLLAVLLFAAPFVAGYLLLSNQPELAGVVLPDVMLDRATAGVGRREAGVGYVQTTSTERPLLAAQLIANNTRVAVSAFASGIFLGIGSLVILAFNGAALGAAAGHFANAGLGGYLWNFVAGHGVLEIFAICLSAAAGFKLGLAVIAPGRWTRADALVMTGRIAVRLVALVVLLLVAAGIIEGMVSASAAAPGIRAAVTGGSALFLVALLAHGARMARKQQRRAEAVPLS